MIITGTLPAANGHVMIRQIVDLWVQHFPVSIVSDVTSAGTRTINLAFPFAAAHIRFVATSATATGFEFHLWAGFNFGNHEALTYRSALPLDTPFHFRLLTNSTGGCFMAGRLLTQLGPYMHYSLIPDSAPTLSNFNSWVDTPGIGQRIDGANFAPLFPLRTLNGHDVFSPVYAPSSSAVGQLKNNPVPHMFACRNLWAALGGEIVTIAGRRFLVYFIGDATLIVGE